MPQTFSARAEIRTRDHCLQTLRYCSQHHEGVGGGRRAFLSFMSHYSHIHSEEKKAKSKFPGGFEPATFSFEGEAITAKPRLLLKIQLKFFQLNKGMVSYSVTGIRGGGVLRTAVLPTDVRTVVSEFTKAANYSNRSPGTYLVVLV